MLNLCSLSLTKHLLFCLLRICILYVKLGCILSSSPDFLNCAKLCVGERGGGELMLWISIDLLRESLDCPSRHLN